MCFQKKTTYQYLILLSFLSIPQLHFGKSKNYIVRRIEAAKRQRESKTNYVSRFITTTAQNIFLLHKNLFHLDTLKVAAPIIPAVLTSYYFDNKIQSHFYDPIHHKNIHQTPFWLHRAAQHATGPTIAFLFLQGLFSTDKDLKYTSHIMLIGVPILNFMNQFIKKLDLDICRRPWHEDFSRHKRSLGGFPSGHLSHATYLAVLYGVRHGYKYALPLSCMSCFIGTVFLVNNRHYLSQLCAGIGFGAAYGLAASKVVDYHLEESVTIQPQYSDNQMGLKVSWQF